MFPDELTKLNNWCVWRLVNRNGKQTKIPINAETGEMAKSNDSDTWNSYETALKVFKETNADGLGFFFEPPYVGVDIDDISDELERYKKGDVESNIVFEFYELLKTYAEISPSGNGIHLIFKGKLPGPSRRKGNVEMYDQGRFFTMTGDTLNKYHEINEPRENSVNFVYRKYIKPKQSVTRVDFGNHGIEHNLSDSEVISKALNSKQGGKFKDLLNGSWEKYKEYPSHSEGRMGFLNILAFWTAKDFQQMDRIFRQSGMMNDKWDEKRGKTTLGASEINTAIHDVNEVFTPSQKRDTLNYEFGDAFFNEKEEKKEYPSRTTDDTGNALRFLDRYGDMVRYSYNRGKFYVYNGSYWAIDDRGQVRVLIDKTIDDMKNEKVFVAEGVDEEDAYEAFHKHIKNSRSNTSKKRMEDELKHHIPITPEDFDPDDMLLNTQNGYLNLTSGEQLEPDKSKMFSMIADSELTENQRPDVWLDFLNDIFNYDQETINFIQRAVGYSLTGSTREQVMFILHGKGRNGKSLFIETIRSILGTYTDNIQAKTLMVKRGDTINNDVAKLQGVRLVTSSEPSEGFRFDEGLIKQLTGGDTVTARFLYGEEFNFDPKFKIWVTTNHKPIVRGTDDGIWRRLLLVPFDVQIPEEKVDKDLKYKLLREAPAILNWAVEGCLEWQENGLQVPDRIFKASEGYRKEMDVIEQFIDDECIVAEGERVGAKELYTAYKKWADEGGEYEMSMTKFGKKMTDKFEKKKSGSMYYLGINLRKKFPGLANFSK